MVFVFAFSESEDQGNEMKGDVVLHAYFGCAEEVDELVDSARSAMN